MSAAPTPVNSMAVCADCGLVIAVDAVYCVARPFSEDDPFSRFIWEFRIHDHPCNKRIPDLLTHAIDRHDDRCPRCRH
jgi:hypothetical protein